MKQNTNIVLRQVGCATTVGIVMIGISTFISGIAIGMMRKSTENQNNKNTQIVKNAQRESVDSLMIKNDKIYPIALNDGKYVLIQPDQTDTAYLVSADYYRRLASDSLLQKIK